MNDPNETPMTQPEENPKSTKTQEELELEIAQERLSEARRKKALAEEQKLQAARAAIAAREAEEIKKRADELAAYNAMVAEHERRRKAKEDAEQAAKARAAQEKLELEKLLAAQEEAKNRREAHEKKIQALDQEVFMLEMDAKQAEADALHMSAPKTEPEPVTLHTPAHPLSKIFGVTHEAPESMPVAPPHVDPVQAPMLREVQPEEGNLLQSEWRLRTASKFSQPTPLQLLNLLRVAGRYADVLSALEEALTLEGVDNRDALVNAVELLLTRKREGVANV